MTHNIIIPYPCGTVVYPHKSVPLWQGTTQIGKASICTHKGVKMAKTDMDVPIDLIARGRLVMREGDIINEFVIIGFEVIEGANLED